MNKNYSICIIGVYFGKLPEYFNLWLNSCKNNPTVDFLVIGDNKLNTLPANVKCVEMSFEEIKKRAEKVLGFECVLDRPYKLCDYKVIYGPIFDDLLKDYDFWGHCDFDLIFGNIRKFITDDILENYDKILDLGHLSLYRNTEENNNRYRLPGCERGDYISVYTNEKIAVFDERVGIYEIYKKNNFPIYDKKVYADISSLRKRFVLANDPKRYMYQAYYAENGGVYRAYIKNKKIYTDEFLYIHFKKRGFNHTLDSSVQKFYICPKGFIEKTIYGEPLFEEIKKINPYSLYQEIKDKVKYYYDYSGKVLNGIKRRIKKALKKEEK